MKEEGSKTTFKKRIEEISKENKEIEKIYDIAPSISELPQT